MPALETPETEGDGSTDGETADDPGDGRGDAEAPESPAPGAVPLDGDRRLSLPADASAEEAAALAAAVSTHLDRQAEPTEAEPQAELDRWKLAARLGARSPSRLPRSIPHGGAWKAASRRR